MVEEKSLAESFFYTLRVNLIRAKIYNSRQEAKTVIFKNIEVFCDLQRRHFYRGYLSPVGFEKKNVA
jgi:putative transposase